MSPACDPHKEKEHGPMSRATIPARAARRALVLSVLLCTLFAAVLSLGAGQAKAAYSAHVVSGVLEPPPAGFQPAAPPSELRDHGGRIRPRTKDNRRCSGRSEGIPGLRSGRNSGAGGGDRTRCFSLTRRASLPSGPRRQVCCWCVWPEGFEPSSPAWRAGILAVGRRPPGLCCCVCVCDGRPGGTFTPVTRSAAVRLDPRPPGGGCQGGARTPTFRVTAGRLAVRLPGTEIATFVAGATEHRDGESNPDLRVEGPVS